MKVFLMHRDMDFDLERELPPNEAALTQDLELDTLFSAMALGDEFLLEMAKRVVQLSLTSADAILYRQQVLADCLAEPAIVRDIYELAVEALQTPKNVGYHWIRDSPDSILRRSAQMLDVLLLFLERLRQIADEHAGAFRSEGFTRFFAMLEEELDEEYLERIRGHVKELRFRRGVLVSAELGKGNKGIRYVLRRPHLPGWRERISRKGGGGSSYTFTIPDRDENGFKALADLRGKGINLVANALAQSTDHILSFFGMLRAELAFYVGCLSLHARLLEKGEPTCFPIPIAPGNVSLSARALYDVCLTLNLEERVVGNDLNADDKRLVMITGANQGGKSTFLRGLGLAQLMMQSGMFVSAESFRANVCDGIFTHYKREEDSSMESGKLDEELSRMSEIAAVITPSSLLLCNESFASTNEREGSEIARQVVRALTEGGIKVIFVTHLFDLAHGFYRQGLDTALFLRAERHPDGRRTFKVVEGEPLSTSFGEDVYLQVFGTRAGKALDVEAAASGVGPGP